MTQVTRSFGLIGWMLFAAPLLAQTPSYIPPQQASAVAPNQQTQPYTNNPNSTGVVTRGVTGTVTGGTNIPPRGQANPKVNPPLRKNWPPSTSSSPAAIRNMPHNNLPGQPAQNTYRRGVVPRNPVPQGTVQRGTVQRGTAVRHTTRGQVPLGRATLAQHMQRQPARVPFDLTDQQQIEVNQVLQQWEKESSNIQTYKCSFTRFEYDSVFGPANAEKTRSKGSISYKQPDKGKFEISEMLQYNPQTNSYEKIKNLRDAPFDHWVCTGDAIYQVKKAEKIITKREIPLERRGQAISDGPLPFLFGAKAEKLRQRYWIRITQSTPTEIWLEAFPRRPDDAASYSRVELILDRKEFLPNAIMLHSPGGKNRVSYSFGAPTVNNVIDRHMPFLKPTAYPGWTLIDETPRPQTPIARPAARLTPVATTPYRRQ